MPAKKQGSAAKKQGSAASKKNSVARKSIPLEQEAALQGYENEEERGEEQEQEDFLGGADETHGDREGGEDEEEEADGDCAEDTMADVTVSTSKASSSGAANMSNVCKFIYFI